MTSMLQIRPHERLRYASTAGRVLTWLRMPASCLLAVIGPIWALVPVAVVVAHVVGRVRIARERWEVDPPGVASELRHGPHARRRVALAELHGIVAMRGGGARHRGLAITRPHERWRLVDRDGTTLGTASTEGFAIADVVDVLRRLDVPVWDAQELRGRGMLPPRSPWVRRRAAILVGIAMVAALSVVLTTPWHTWSALLER